MEQEQVGEGDRAIAHRLFNALCELYPDRYITLIDPREVAVDPPPSLSLLDVEAPTAPR